MKVLNDTKFIFNDLGSHSCSFRTNLVLFRSFRCSLFPKPVSSLGLFFAASYSKTALGSCCKLYHQKPPKCLGVFGAFIFYQIPADHLRIPKNRVNNVKRVFIPKAANLAFNSIHFNFLFYFHAFLRIPLVKFFGLFFPILASFFVFSFFFSIN